MALNMTKARKRKPTTTGAAAATKLAVAAAAAGTQARSSASDLGDRIAPVVGEARERIAPVVEEARERIAPVADDARERLADLAGTVATRLDDALPDRVTPAVVKHRAAKEHPNRLLQALFVLGLGAVAAVVTRRLTSGGSSGSQPTWRSADGVPATTATTSTGAAGPAATGTTGTAETSVDVAGGTPEEMAADGTDAPHPVTTPDQPAQRVVLD